MPEREQVAPSRPEEQVVVENHSDARGDAAISQSDVSKEEVEFQRVMVVGRKVMSDHYAVLAALAK